MPYEKNEELPESVKKNLPTHAQNIYRESFNHAQEEYKDPDKRKNPHDSLEEISHRVEWNAVKKKYIKDEDGNLNAQ